MRALLVVDVQNDFCPGGALQIAGGDRVIDPANRAAGLFAEAGLPVLASRDWHPPETRHFREWGGPWPVHCVANTTGAEFHPRLRLPEETVIFSKGIDPEMHGYSAFEGVTGDRLPLVEVLDELGVERLFLCGLATDYCVLRTSLDARAAGLRVTVLTDAVAGVDVTPGDCDRALQQMKRAGAEFATVAELPEILERLRSAGAPAGR
jgi:nicotinamidase/pyrazinamidase